MFFKYNQTTQSSSAAGQEAAMAQSLNLKAAEPMNIQYEYEPPVAKSAAKQTPQKGYPFPNNKRYKKLMDLQTRFSLADGKMVWQKLPKDLPLYYATIGLVTVGIGLTVYSLKMLATPPKNQ